MTEGNEYPLDMQEEQRLSEESKQVDAPLEASLQDAPGSPGHRESTFKTKRPLSWQFIRFIGFFFLGWNGLQIVFLPTLVFIVLNNDTFLTLLTSLSSESAGFMPLMIFLIATFIGILFILHLLSEMEYRSRLSQYTIAWREVPMLLLNYGTPLLMQYLFVMFLQCIVFALLYAGYNLLSPIFHWHLDMFEVIYRSAIIFITFPWIIMQFMLDTTLERGVRGRSFSYCYRRAHYLFAHKTGDIFRYLLLRLTLIMISLVFFKVLIYSVILPAKIYAFYTWNLSTSIMFVNMLSTSDVVANALKLIAGLLITGFLFALISTPLYWLNTKLIKNYLNKTAKL